MTALKTFQHAISLFIIFLLAAVLPALAQENGGEPPAPEFTKERLAQMLAPVALYPDALLSQVLMASTYPLELVEADRWIRQNPGLQGDRLDEALKDREWDPSVKSLCHFPSVLGAMSEKLAQTTRLGDAFLAQQDEVMDTVQELRRAAREQGNLSTSQEQKVLVDDDRIVIEPANPDVIYVPAYDPLYVYGPWWYPSYPPYVWGPGPVIFGSAISFWPGIFVDFTIGSWSYFDWRRHYIHVDWNKTHRFHHRDRHRGDTDKWQHDPDHRRGVAYRYKSTAQKFGQSPLRSREMRRDVRGYPEQPVRGIHPVRPRRGDYQQDRSGSDRRSPVGSVYRGREIGRENPFSRVHEGKEERMSSERGRGSREVLRSGPMGGGTPRTGRSDGLRSGPMGSSTPGTGRSQGGGNRGQMRR